LFFQEDPIRIEGNILLKAATTHSTEEHKTGGAVGCEDRHYFLDIDMTPLGASPEEYEKYSTKVREEYSFLPDAMYRNLRLRVSEFIFFIKFKTAPGRRLFLTPL